MPQLTITQRYLVGLCATFTGAALTEWSGSMLPLALGASFTLIVTVGVVRVLCSSRGRSRPRRRR